MCFQRDVGAVGVVIESISSKGGVMKLAFSQNTETLRRIHALIDNMRRKQSRNECSPPQGGGKCYQ